MKTDQDETGLHHYIIGLFIAIGIMVVARRNREAIQEKHGV